MIKTEQDSDSVKYLGELFLGFPVNKMVLTWDQLKVETHLRNVLTSKIEDHLFALEGMSKRNITVTGFQCAYKSVEALMLDLKAVNAAFRKKAAENAQLENEKTLRLIRGQSLNGN